MAYEKTTWVNGQAPALDAEHLNKIEQGIADAVSVTPQTLSDDQKSQARENINAAPGGFGLGELTGRTANSFADITGYGFYRIPSESNFAPDTSSNWGAVYIGASLSYGTLLYARNNALMAVRAVSGGEVGPIEWVNPPMELGTEYRTTERFLGKPVYVKVVDCGTIPAQGTHKDLIFSPDASAIVSVAAYSPIRGNTLPYYDTNGVRYSIAGSGKTVMIWNYSESMLDTNVYALVKYTKTTD